MKTTQNTHLSTQKTHSPRSRLIFERIKSKAQQEQMIMLPMNRRNGGPKHDSERAAQRIANLASNMRSVQSNDNNTCLGPTFQPGTLRIFFVLPVFRESEPSNSLTLVESSSTLSGPFDVICARGKSAFQHPGNQRFRALIETRVEDYASASNKFEKSVIVSQIVDEVRNASPNGGFIRSEKGLWYEVGDAAREKVGQRYVGRHLRRRSSLPH